MTPQEKRKELLSATLLKKLERRHFEAYYCPTATEAIEKVLSLIPEGSSIMHDRVRIMRFIRR